MVEICRWPNASLSVSLTICIEMPSRPAFSRSTLMNVRRPRACTSEATSRSSGECCSCWARRSPQISTSLVSVPTSVYWYCARLRRVPIWMSCTGWKKTWIAGNRCDQVLASGSITSVTNGLRSSRGLSAIVSRPALGVAFSVVTPTIDTTPVTSGSWRIASTTLACSFCISANEISCPASVTAVISPVSCGGRKPFGMMM